jgi:hypothetical protein
MIRGITGYGAGDRLFIRIHDSKGIAAWADFFSNTGHIIFDTLIFCVLWRSDRDKHELLGGGRDLAEGGVQLTRVVVEYRVSSRFRAGAKAKCGNRIPFFGQRW